MKCNNCQSEIRKEALIYCSICFVNKIYEVDELEEIKKIIEIIIKRKQEEIKNPYSKINWDKLFEVEAMKGGKNERNSFKNKY